MDLATVQMENKVLKEGIELLQAHRAALDQALLEQFQLSHRLRVEIINLNSALEKKDGEIDQLEKEIEKLHESLDNSLSKIITEDKV